MSGEGAEAEQFLALVVETKANDPVLTSLQAGLIVAAELGIATDSRTFARVLGVPHALVLREVNILIDLGKLDILRRDPRSSKIHYCSSPVCR